MSGERIGIVGGGQLGRMLTQAAKPLGFEVTVTDPNVNCPAAQVGADQIVAALNDGDAIEELARSSDVVTWEIEHIDTKTLLELEKGGVKVEPSPETLALIKDKYRQKGFLRSQGIPVADFWPIEGVGDLDTAYTEGTDSRKVIKSRFGGYDGRGNLVIDRNDWSSVVAKFGENSGNFNIYAEEFIPFKKELSVLAVRDARGEVAVYPPVETVHKDNICDYVISPALLHGLVAEEATEIAHETVRHLGGAGVFAIEMFLTEDEQLLVNEIAPRVHNSGHLTIEGSATSQFEQHIRAVSGLPLGSTEITSPAAMTNLLYGPVALSGIRNALSLPGTHLHLYGKEPAVDKPRKIGHVTSLDITPSRALEKALKAREEFYNG